MIRIRRLFLQIMIAFALSAAELGGNAPVQRRQAIVRIMPPEPIYPPRYLPVRRRRLYEDLEVCGSGDAPGVTSRFN